MNVVIQKDKQIRYRLGKRVANQSGVIKNPDIARRLGATGRQTVEQYRWSVVASQVAKYYEDCLSSTDGIAGTREI